MGQSVAAPLTGAYFWMPRPMPDCPVWDLVTCHDLGVWDGISHRELWPHVVELLAVGWGKDATALKDCLHAYHTGLPRGRITHPKPGHVIIHGNDAPAAGWLNLVKVRFRLTKVKVIPEYTEHEKMLGDDLRALQDALGIPLALNLTV